MDNLLLEELAGVQPPSDLSATAATSPDNKDSLTVTFTPDGTNDVLLVYSTVDTFGTPVDATTYSAGESITGGGTVAGVFSSTPANITGLIPGTIYYVAAYSIDGSGSYSDVSSSTSGTTDSFAIQTTGFGDWTAVSVASSKDWTVSASSASAGNFGGDAPGEDWLISSALDLDASVDETFEFTYRDQYDDIESVTGLEVFYTTAYTGDPSTTTWTAFTALNTELDNHVAGGSSSSVASSVDLSGITGTTVSLAFKYTSSGTGGGSTRNWYLSDALISGNDASDPAITLSPTPASVAEGASLALTLTVPSTVSGDTDFYLTSNGDGSELSFPASVTVLDGTSSISFNVDGLTDSTLDGDITVLLTANAADYTLSTIDLIVTDIDAPTPSSDIIFTQYYEGSSSNKWVEITNIGDVTVDLNTYQVAVWSNANTEAWKADGAGALEADYTLDLTGVSLGAGQSYVIANSSAALPYSSSLADATSSITYFNGNDSLILYTDPTGYLTSNISDAIAFTNSGFEGGNKGFIRTEAYVGYDLDAGSSIEDYDDDNSGPAVWTEITTATADDAVIGDDAYIGTTALATPPSEVSFTTAAQSVAESDGNINLNVQVTGLSSGTVTVQVDFNADNSTADLTDITYSAPQQITFDASSLVSPQTITIPIVDDGLDGGTEIASFDLSVISGTVLLASPSTHNVSITDDDFTIPDIFISELADPNDNYNGRYVELYNSTDSDVDLAAGNWNLVVYFNA
ncbi:MAG: lamin tail domain-containing protein, partial [Puniceicoccaceae bacterium]|nr:lamin tail domain-containing protein [Puniceicoccaceae bacterium]